MTCGSPVCMVVTMMSAHTARPSNEEVQPPAALPEGGLGQAHDLGGIGVDADHVGLEGRAVEGRHEQGHAYSPGANLSMAASERCPASLVSVYMPSQSVPTL
mgnify:CR=1 FL=1